MNDLANWNYKLQDFNIQELLVTVSKYSKTCYALVSLSKWNQTPFYLFILMHLNQCIRHFCSKEYELWMIQKIRIYGVCKCNRTFVCFRRLMFCVPKKIYVHFKTKMYIHVFCLHNAKWYPYEVVKFIIFKSIIKSTFIRQITFPVDFQKSSCFKYFMILQFRTIKLINMVLRI